MQPYAGPGRIRWAPFVAGSFAVVIVGLLVVPASGLGPMTRTFVPPFRTAHPLIYTASCRCGGTFQFSTHPDSDVTSGAVTMSMHASHADRPCRSSCTLGEEEAGFRFGISAASAGSRTISAQWSLSWSAMASCTHCHANLTSGATAQVTVWLLVLDVASGRTKNSTSSPVFQLIATNGTLHSSGWANASLSVVVGLLGHHRYLIMTYVVGAVSAPDTLVPSAVARASVDLASLGAGATLGSVRIV